MNDPVSFYELFTIQSYGTILNDSEHDMASGYILFWVVIHLQSAYLKLNSFLYVLILEVRYTHF